jgi:hypothetical protein
LLVVHDGWFRTLAFRSTTQCPGPGVILRTAALDQQPVAVAQV